MCMTYFHWDSTQSHTSFLKFILCQYRKTTSTFFKLSKLNLLHMNCIFTRHSLEAWHFLIFIYRHISLFSLTKQGWGFSSHLVTALVFRWQRREYPIIYSKHDQCFSYWLQCWNILLRRIKRPSTEGHTVVLTFYTLS